MVDSAESFPNTAPIPSCRPKLFETNSKLILTPEKKVNVVNEAFKSIPVIKSGVTVKENVKDFDDSCPLSYPALNSTNRLVQQLEEVKNAVFNNKQVLEEISDVNMKTHSKLNHLDYDLNDRRYASLTSLSSQVKTTLPRTQCKLKKQDEKLQPPLIEDLRFLAEYDTEIAKIDYKVDFGCVSESGDDFDYLFDLYRSMNFL